MPRFPVCDYRIRILVLLSFFATGCRAPRSQPSVSRESATFYSQVAARVAYPEGHGPPAIATQEPRSIREPQDDEIWSVTLFEAIHIAMSNNKTMLVNSEFLAEGSRLLANPDFAPSIFDLAIEDSGILLGSRGTAAALSDFDPRFSTSMVWGRDELVQNNVVQAGVPAGQVLVEDNAAFNARLEKTLPSGAEVALTHDWNYTSNNGQGRLFPSAYDGSVGVELRQPLWAGAGPEFTSIAGPIGQLNPRNGGVNQGIVIARINRNISFEEFATDVRKQLYDVVNIYWDLYFAYQQYEIERDIRDRTKETWDQVKAKAETGHPGGGAADEAQANEEYLAGRARTEVALAQLWETEAHLRRLMGLSANDGRLIKPVDSPVTDQVHVDWRESLTNALVLRNELRRQKCNIKSLELQLAAARSLVNPRLDLVAGYKVNGFGDRLTASNDDDGQTAQGHRSAYGNLFQGDQTSWDLGVVMSVPLGVRAERSQVRNLELRIAKARAILVTQEMEVSHELSHAFNLLDRSYTTAGTNSERRVAADRRVNAFEAEYENDRVSVDALLRARISQAQSRIEYQRSVTDYNKAIANVHFRSGTLPDTYNIHVADTEENAAPSEGDTTKPQDEDRTRERREEGPSAELRAQSAELKRVTSGV